MKDESCLIVLTHNTGQREIYIKDTPESDAHKLLKLSDEEARTLGSILEGTFFHPVKDESIKAHISEETIIEWFTVEPGSPVVAKTLGEQKEFNKDDLIIVALEKDKLIPLPGSDTKVEIGDTLIVMGKEETIERLERDLFSH